MVPQAAAGRPGLSVPGDLPPPGFHPDESGRLVTPIVGNWRACGGKPRPGNLIDSPEASPAVVEGFLCALD